MRLNTNILALLLFLICLLPALSFGQRTIELGAFDGVYVTGNIEVLLEKGDENKVELYVDGMPYDKISVKIQREVLRLRVLESWLYRDEVIKAYVTYKSLDDIRANAGATIESEELIENDQMRLKATSGARIELSLRLESLEANASEGGVLELEGETEKQDIQVGTGGRYEGLSMDAKRTYVRTNTGGQAEVVALEILEAAANTGGAIRYKGDPETKNIKTVIAGEVRPYN